MTVGEQAEPSGQSEQSDRTAPEHDSSYPAGEQSHRESAPLRLPLPFPLALILIFILITLAMTWPLAAHLGSAVQDLGDPLDQIWAFRTVQHQLIHDPGRLWDGTQGYPYSMSLLFSEPGISTAILGWPVQVVSGNDILTYNLLFLTTFVVLGVGMALLVQEITNNQGAALLAGVLAAYTPYRYGHLSHLNLLSYGWIPLVLWTFIRFSRTRRTRYIVLGTLFLAIQLLASDTLAFMALGMLLVGLPFIMLEARRSGGGQHLRRLLLGYVVMMAVPVLCLVPDLLARLEVSRRYGFTRSLDVVRRMSAHPGTYISVSGNVLWGKVLPHAYPGPLFAGAIAFAGVLLGVTLGWRRRPSWTLYALLIAAGGFVLSLGPDIRIFGHLVTLPYRWLYDDLPGFSSMRDADRFGMVALLGLQLLAGIGFAAGWERLRPHLSVRRLVPVGTLLLVLLIGAALTESYARVGAVTVPNDHATNAVYDWLADQPPGPVFELPANGLWRNLGWNIDQMYRSTIDWHPIVAAYGSFLPQLYVNFMVAFHGGTTARSVVDAGNVGLLQDIGIRYVVVHRQPGYDWQAALSEANRLPELTPDGSYGDATVFLLRPAKRPPLRYRLQLPSRALAGGTIVTNLTAVNTNRNLRATGFTSYPAATTEWRDASGKVVSSTTEPLNVVAAAKPGITTAGLYQSGVPDKPGNYRLTVSSPALGIDVTQPVQVTSISGETAGPPLALLGVRWTGKPYQPGSTIDVNVSWQVRGASAAARQLTMTVQLIGADGHNYGQLDEAPLDGALLMKDWQPGMTILDHVPLTVPPGISAGSYRLLVALYDGAATGQPRINVVQPDGRVGDTYQSPGTVTIRSP